MKAYMDENGKITIRPESAIEVHALKRWLEDAMVSVSDLDRDETCLYIRSSRLLVTADPISRVDQ